MINKGYYSKISVLILILIIIPTTTIAFDNESTIIQEPVDNKIQTEVYVSLTGDDNNTGTIDSPKLTLDGENGAIAYANSKNITKIILDNGTFHVDGANIDSSVYKLNTLLIQGSKSTILSAVNSNIFNIGSQNLLDQPMNITFQSIDFTNSKYYLPAITNFHSYLTLINCNFYNNGGSSSSGIGSYYNSTTKIYNSKFFDNKDRMSMGIIESSAGGYGGSEYITNNVLIENCQFFNNLAYDGGVIFNIADSTINVTTTIKNSSFINNEAIENGGVIYGVGMNIANCKGSTTINIENCTFKDNVAGSIGGAIHTGGNTVLNVNNSKFINNQALSNLSINNAGAGGAIFAGEGSARIYNCEFRLNKAERGGAIFNTMSEDIILINSTFIQNKATMGGGVYMDLSRDYGQYSLFKNNTFDSNIADIGEGLFSNDLNMEEDRIELFNCTNSIFKNNTIFNVGNLGLYHNNFINSDIFNTGVLLTRNNTYSSSIVKNNTKPVTITFLGNVSGYYGDTVKIQAKVSNSFSNDLIVFKIGIYEYMAFFNQSSGLYEYNYKINVDQNEIITAYSKLDNNSTSNNISVSVFKLPVNLTLEIKNMYLNETLNISVWLNSNNNLLSACITVSIENKQYNVYVKNGYGNALFNNTSFKAGEKVATASYGKNSIKYEHTNVSTTFMVYSMPDLNQTSIMTENIELYYKNGTRFSATLVDYYNKPIANEKIIFIINGVENERITNNEGKASIAINLIPNIYNITTVFEGSQNYTPSSVNNTVTVLSTIIGNDMTKIFRNSTQYCAKFLDSQGNILKGVKVSFNINGVFYNRTTNDEGIAKLNINLNPAIYIITAKNPFNNQSYSNNVTVLSSINGNNLVKYFQNSSQYYATFYNSDGTPLVGVKVSFNINGVFYNRTTDGEGIAKLNINLKQGNYIITAFNPINNQLYSNNVTVLPVLVGEDLQLNYRDGSKYYVKALDGNGKPANNAAIKFNINGVFYDRITKEDGLANLTINLMPGTYIISTYWGNEIIANTVTVIQ